MSTCGRLDFSPRRRHIRGMGDDAKIIRIDFRRRDSGPPDIAMQPVVSSNIAAVGYSERRQILRLRFVAGDSYDYAGVPPQVYRSFFDAPSKGRFVNARIKPFYKCTPVR